MTRSNAREIAVHLIFSLGFGDGDAQSLLDSQLTRERFQELAEDSPLYAQFPNYKKQPDFSNNASKVIDLAAFQKKQEEKKAENEQKEKDEQESA